MREKVGRLLCGTGITIAWILVMICLPLTLPKLFGWQIFAVLTGSMEPSIPAGSLVWIKPCPESEIESQDVIAFYNSPQNGTIILHRVVEKRTLDGTFLTKGDANTDPDPVPVSFALLVGKAVCQIPVLGTLAMALSSDLGKALSFLMIWTALGFYFVGKNLCSQRRIRPEQKPT